MKEIKHIGFAIKCPCDKSCGLMKCVDVDDKVEIEYFKVFLKKEYAEAEMNQLETFNSDKLPTVTEVEILLK